MRTTDAMITTREERWSTNS